MHDNDHNICLDCGKDVPRDFYFVSLEQCVLCHCKKNPPQQVVNFNDLLTRDLLNFRHLLCSLVPPDVQKNIVAKYNDEINADHANEVHDLEKTWTHFKAVEAA